MEVMQEQYKDTKIGRIPKDWDVVKLGDVVKYSQGIQVDLGLQKYEPCEGYIRFLRIENYTQLSQDFRFIPIPSKKDKIIAKEDIVVVRYGATAGTVGRGFEGVLANNLFKVTPNKKLDRGFLFRYISSLYSYLQSLMSGGAMPALNFGMLNLLYTPLPPLPEQQKIAEILSTVDEQISTTQAIIDKSKELKKGLMQKLFSEGIGHTEFKDTKIGRLPKDWEVVRLGNCSKLLTGGTPSTKVKEYWDGNIPWMASGDIHKRYIEDVEGRITELGLEKSATKIIPINSVLIALNGQGRTKGTVAINLKEITCNQSLAAYVLNEDKFNPLFVLFFLTTRYWHLRALAGGDDRAGLNLGLLRTVECILPSLSEQQKIVNILSEADAKIEKEEKEKAQLEQLKKGLMQQLLTGKKRVKV